MTEPMAVIYTRRMVTENSHYSPVTKVVWRHQWRNPLVVLDGRVVD